ncbi:DUF4410 domain-containing protein [Dongia soli]|uniref:DUF4410 domain-containing protein n=1 Tax=Dongia soli TaxID=600628 RepID=A0ABU5E5L9_9PROT|nr:DUF4410 domain-containing protein [Dongia soli]MDY0881498.1 DUF4410 domain-containing protein [Dongia soli]
MTHIRMAIVALAFLCSACGSTSTDYVQKAATDTKLPYPQRILVYDFAVTTSEIPADNAAVDTLSVAIDNPHSTPENLALAHQIAGVLAQELVTQLKDLGLPAQRWSGPPPKMENGYAIMGQFLTIDEGNRLGRMIIGFGVGGTELKVLAQAYRITPGGKILLSAVEVSAESSKKPGIAATLPIGAALSGVATAAAVSTGVGVVTEMNQDIERGARDTATAIVDLMKPRMKQQGWI